ncbi:hypothetical protein [Flavobacterium sharifuzzamanii]|uniref:hypothetical protein n=1 Tax=Flavobacterium sharifuzzamanii TaxID=2211133 RepID=UPI000DAD9BAD|nr:hypothetical protein [Flavobacterium sharifuzzamanii]KAF2080255.1 hypothetical protein DMA14_13210 [Flavobacterium sharifuzzamanii]
MKFLNEYSKIENEEFINNLKDEDLSNLINELCEYWFKHEKSGNSIYSNPIWYSFEHRIWRLGEDLRLLLKKKKGFKKSMLIQDTIIDILKNDKYGKGRQTFALLIGELKCDLMKDDIKMLLSDKDIYGHLIISLRKLKIKGFDEKMKSIINSEKGWIKSEAKKYLDKSASW